MAREPDAPPEDKVAAASVGRGQGSGVPRRSVRGRAQRGRLAIFCAAVGGPGPGLREGSSGAGPREARGRVQQVGVPGTWLWGLVGGGISGAQEGERGGCARPQPSQGWLRGPTPIHLPEAFLGVKTSRPRKDSSERDFASLNLFKMYLGAGGVTRQGHVICLLGDLNSFSKVKSVGFKQRSLLIHVVSRCWKVYSPKMGLFPASDVGVDRVEEEGRTEAILAGT